MLYLTRKVGESVIVNDDIEITVVEVRGRSIKLGFTFPPEVSVLRREIYERIQAENQAAAAPESLPQELSELLKSQPDGKASGSSAPSKPPIVEKKAPRSAATRAPANNRQPDSDDQ